MNILRKVLLGAAVAAMLAGAASAIQPGTTGTDKTYQNMGLRSGVLIQKNNTATAASGAATLNGAGSGIITSEALTTAAAAEYTLTLTNNMISAGDVVGASVQFGTSTTGSPFVRTVAPASGSVVIIIRNGASGDAVLNGTLKIAFWVIKQSVTGAD